MKRIAVMCTLTIGLAACSGSPFDDDTVGTDEASSANADVVTGFDLDEELTGDGLVFSDNGTPDDPTDDTIVINNIPFDNVDASGGAYNRAGALPNGFDRYENPLVGADGELSYFAVFRRSDFAEVAAVGTGNFVAPGTGGLIAQRTGAAGLPDARPTSYTFTGDYAAVRIGTANGGDDDVTFVTGDAVLQADILDFDNEGAVVGTVDNRQLYDVNGVFVQDLDDFISLTSTGIDFDTASIDAADAATVDADGTVLGNGQWDGVFAGPNGEELAGIIVIEGVATSTEAPNNVRETGTFIVVNGG